MAAEGGSGEKVGAEADTEGGDEVGAEGRDDDDDGGDGGDDEGGAAAGDENSDDDTGSLCSSVTVFADTLRQLRLPMPLFTVEEWYKEYDRIGAPPYPGSDSRRKWAGQLDYVRAELSSNRRKLHDINERRSEVQEGLRQIQEHQRQLWGFQEELQWKEQALQERERELREEERDNTQWERSWLFEKLWLEDVEYWILENQDLYRECFEPSHIEDIIRQERMDREIEEIDRVVELWRPNDDQRALADVAAAAVSAAPMAADVGAGAAAQPPFVLVDTLKSTGALFLLTGELFHLFPPAIQSFHFSDTFRRRLQRPGQWLVPPAIQSFYSSETFRRQLQRPGQWLVQQLLHWLQTLQDPLRDRLRKLRVGLRTQERQLIKRLPIPLPSHHQQLPLDQVLERHQRIQRELRDVEWGLREEEWVLLEQKRKLEEERQKLLKQREQEEQEWQRQERERLDGGEGYGGVGAAAGDEAGNDDAESQRRPATVDAAAQPSFAVAFTTSSTGASSPEELFPANVSGDPPLRPLLV